MRFPTIAEVALHLRGVDTACPDVNDLPEDDRYIDVRLQVWPDGTWAIHTGDSSYDQDHRGYWGASSLPMLGTGRFNARETARELIDQAKDHKVQADWK